MGTLLLVAVPTISSMILGAANGYMSVNDDDVVSLSNADTKCKCTNPPSLFKSDTWCPSGQVCGAVKAGETGCCKDLGANCPDGKKKFCTNPPWKMNFCPIGQSCSAHIPFIMEGCCYNIF